MNGSSGIHNFSLKPRLRGLLTRVVLQFLHFQHGCLSDISIRRCSTNDPFQFGIPVSLFGIPVQQFFCHIPSFSILGHNPQTPFRSFQWHKLFNHALDFQKVRNSALISSSGSLASSKSSSTVRV